MEEELRRPFSLTTYGSQEVAAVILARNEERTIGEAVKGAARFAHKVIVMDGHSSDQTAAIASGMGAKVYTDPGRGKGGAIRQSLTLTDADVIVFMDADGSHDPSDIPRLALPVIRGETDLCVGSRFAGGSDELSVSVGQLIRTIGNISMNIAINKRWQVALTDTLNGFRAVDRQAALNIGLREDRHTIEQEMVMKMLRHGYRVINTPTHEYNRKFGESHINIWKEWPMFVWCVFVNLIPGDLPKRKPPLEPSRQIDNEAEKAQLETREL
jgi:dolichol-phosphate hexosyltransferase